jgi:hypothetical protein
VIVSGMGGPSIGGGRHRAPMGLGLSSRVTPG